MPRSPLKPLSSAVLVFLLCASSARAQNFTENHPGLYVEWIQQTEGLATDVAVGDADGDGDVDLFVVDGSTLETWVNDGRGQFVVRPGSICTFPVASVLTMDLDGDKKLDVIATARTGTAGIAVMKGLGGGRFAVPEISAAGQQYRDIVEYGVGQPGHHRLLAICVEPRIGFDVLVQDPAGFEIAESRLEETMVSGLACADFDNDGTVDVVVSGRSRVTDEALIEVLLGTPGQLRTATRFVHYPETYRFAPVDLDGDGDLDLVTGDDLGTSVFVSDGTGLGWTERTDDKGDGESPCVLASDLDQDGRTELLIGYRSSYQGVALDEYSTVEDPRLESPRHYSFMHVIEGGLPPSEILSADLNGDGLLDLVIRSEFLRWPRSYPAQVRGQVAVVLSRPDGTLGAIGFRQIKRVGYTFTSTRMHDDKHPTLLLYGRDGVFSTSLLGNDLTSPIRIADGPFVKAVDLDRDGRDDLILDDGSHTEIRLTTRDGRPGNVTARFDGKVVDVGDLDQDPYPDLLIRRSDETHEIIWGKPHGRMGRVSHLPWSPGFEGQRAPVVIADVDGNGRNELVQLRVHYSHYWSQDHEPDTVTVYSVMNNGTTRQMSVSVFLSLHEPYNFVTEIRAADLDGIPGEELVLVNEADGFNGSHLVVLRAERGSYSLGSSCPVIGEWPNGLTLADLDGDGDIDASCTASYEGFEGILYIRWNDGHGNLGGDWSRRLSEGSGRGTVAADFDNDGVIDLAVLAPNYQDSENTRIAFLFGRRDDVSATISDLTLDSAPVSPTISLAIGDIAPNPAHGAFAIRWSAHPGEPVDLEVHDVAGRRVRSERLEAIGAGERETRFDPGSDLPAGLYWIRLRQGNLTATRRVVLVR